MFAIHFLSYGDFPLDAWVINTLKNQPNKQKPNITNGPKPLNYPRLFFFFHILFLIHYLGFPPTG